MKKPLSLLGICISCIFLLSPYLSLAEGGCTNFSAQVIKTDITCPGANDGQATIVATGGNGGYSFKWDNNAGNATTSTIKGLSASNGIAIYSAMVTDDKGCKTTVNVKIYEPAPLNLICSGVDPNCFDGTDGSASISVSGGTMPYFYLWDDNAAQTTDTATGLSAGTYTVIVTDNNGCMDTCAVTLGEPSLLANSFTAIDVNCPGGSNGKLTANPSGATPPYTYQWDANAKNKTSKTVSGLKAGSYVVTVTDANGCSTADKGLVSQPDLIMGKTSTQDVICPGSSDGMAEVVVTGGTPPYSFKWNDPSAQTTSKASGLSTGMYMATITDDNGCIGIAKAFIEGPDPFDVTPFVQDNVCSGDSNGIISLTVSGATPPYSYLWDNGDTTSTISGLTAGKYSFTITDDANCTFVDSQEVEEPSPVFISGLTLDASCNGICDGQANVVAFFGTPPYTYLWSTGDTVNILMNLCAGDYIVTATDSNGCIVTDTFEVIEPDSLFVTTTTIDELCNGSGDGKINTQVTGGNPPSYTYSWSDGQFMPSATGLSPGVYSVTVTDPKGCSATASDTISKPAPLTAGASFQGGNTTPVTCNGDMDGTANVLVSGGTPPYTYLWSNGDTTQTITGLSGGTYICTVTDDNGCPLVNTVTVFEPPVLQATISENPSNCFGACDGTASVSAAGGNPPYKYSWSNGDTTATVSGLCSGNYDVTITDSKLCTIVKSIMVNQPPTLISSASKTDVSCLGACNGTASASATGGTPPYTYSWSNGEISASIDSLCGGSYTVIVTDSNSCSDTSMVLILESPPLTIDKKTTNLTCHNFCNGTATAYPIGGKPPYSFLWNNGSTSQARVNLCAGTYKVTVMDANGCTATNSLVVLQPTPLIISKNFTNVTCGGICDGTASPSIAGGKPPLTYAWSDGSTLANRTGLCPGSYTVTVTDANGCTASNKFNILQPSPMFLTKTTQDASCDGVCDGSASVSVSGGTPPLSYSWSNGETTSAIDSLCGGIYTVTVTDANGCTASKSCTINQSPPIALFKTFTNVSCFGACDGSASVSVSGGQPPFAYSWSHGDTTPAISDLCAGPYGVIVTDANGCTAIAVFNITEPDSLIITSICTPVTCFGAKDGTATSFISGGTQPYILSWFSNTMHIDTIPPDTAPAATGLGPGFFYGVIVDVNGCIDSTACEITEPDPATLTFETNDVSCAGGMDGTAKVIVSGGIPPYTYLWSNGATTDSIGGISGGTYSVTVFYGNGCTAVDSITINESPSPVMASLVATDVTCPGRSDGTLTIAVSGGVSPYIVDANGFVFPFGGGPLTVGNIAVGTYTAIVTDQNGCTDTVVAIVGEPDSVKATFVVTPTTCRSVCDGVITMTISGGNGNYGFQVAGIDNIFTYVSPVTATGLCAGNYFITVGDDNLCIAEYVVNLPQPDPIVIVMSSTPTLCDADSTGTATASASGGNGGPYTFLWNDADGQTTSTATGLAAGTYFVSVEDINGCGKIAQVQVQAGSTIISTTATDDVVCTGSCAGQVSVSVDNPINPPYTYLWDDSKMQTTSTAVGLCAGEYHVTVTDANGCFAVDTAIITSVPKVDVSIKTSQTKKPTCFGDSDGKITVKMANGVAPFTFQWDDPLGQTTISATGLSSGTYCVTVTDQLGCSDSLCYFLEDPKELILEFDSTADCIGPPCNGNAVVSVLGNPLGIGLSFLWSNGDTDPFNLGICAGVYSVTVTETNGCSASGSVQVDSVVCRSGQEEMNPKDFRSSLNGFTTKVFPNPFVNTTNLVIKSTYKKNIDVRLYNLMGQEVKMLYEGNVESMEEKLIQIQRDDLPTGTYIYRVISDGEMKGWGKLILIAE